MSPSDEEDVDSDHPVARLEQLQDDVLRQLDDLNAKVLLLLDEQSQSQANVGALAAD